MKTGGEIEKQPDFDTVPPIDAPPPGAVPPCLTGKIYWNVKDATKLKLTVDSFALPQDLLALLPTVEEIKFVRSSGSKVVQKEGRRTGT